jgi:hypothetical protein
VRARSRLSSRHPCRRRSARGSQRGSSPTPCEERDPRGRVQLRGNGPGRDHGDDVRQPPRGRHVAADPGSCGLWWSPTPPRSRQVFRILSSASPGAPQDQMRPRRPSSAALLRNHKLNRYRCRPRRGISTTSPAFPWCRVAAAALGALRARHLLDLLWPLQSAPLGSFWFCWAINPFANLALRWDSHGSARRPLWTGQLLEPCPKWCPTTLI